MSQSKTSESQQIALLQQQLDDLLRKASTNQWLLDHFQQFELKLMECDRFEPLLSVLLDEGKELLEVDALSLWLLDPEHSARDLLPSRHLHRYPVQFIDEAERLQELYPQGPLPVIGPLPMAERRQLFDEPEIESAVLLPLRRHDYLIGSLNIGSRSSSRFSPNQSTDFLAHLATVIAVCLENSISQEHLQRLSITDMLTRIHNRRYFMKRFGDELNRASRTSQSLACLFIDLDHFKRINDQFGHTAGDRVLRSVAHQIQQLLRRPDTLARYGGEEFTLLLPDCDKQQAIQTAERIRQTIATHRTFDQQDREIPVTLSIGVSCYQGQTSRDTDLSHLQELLLNQADRALYHAKAQGRNQVCFMELDANSDRLLSRQA